MDPRDELSLVQRAQAGDRTAFEDLIRAHARLVWASVYGWVRDLKQPEAFRGWLLTIARRLSWRQAEVAGRTDLMASVPERPAPVDEADAEEAREEVQKALARLPERYRVPVTLHLLNGLEYGAIEKATGLANGSLRGLVARGVAKLRAELAPWWRSRHEHS